MPTAVTRLSLAQARRMRISDQPVDRTSADNVVGALETSGFIRTLGDVEAHLALEETPLDLPAGWATQVPTKARVRSGVTGRGRDEL